MLTFTTHIEVRWADIDANMHMRHSAYADWCTHARVGWMQEAGFGPDHLLKLGIGPVLFRESTEYQREVKLGEKLTIHVTLAAATPENDRWRIRHVMHKADGTIAAIHEVAGAWLDLRARKLAQPPKELSDFINSIPHTNDFEVLPTSKKPD